MDFLLSSPHLLLPCLCLFFFFSPCTSTDTLLPTHNHKDGETIVSAGKTFALGFFSPGNTTNRYVGIWLQNIPDENVVWVANRENPLPNASGVVTITHRPQQSSHLGREPPTHMVSDCEEECNKRQVVGFWQPGAERQPRKDAVAKLRLPHQHNASRIENRHRLPNLERFLTSWKSPNDPAQGEFSVRLDPQGLPEFFLWQSSNRIWRSGPWTDMCQ